VSLTENLAGGEELGFGVWAGADANFEKSLADHWGRRVREGSKQETGLTRARGLLGTTLELFVILYCTKLRIDDIPAK
jgi:hypothetical protein